MRFFPKLAILLVGLLFFILPAHTQEDGGEKYEFQAEVSRLMDIIINSLYANKDVFLRELLSNASDALDRIRFLGVKDGDKVLGEGENRELEVRISFDKEARTLTIRDRGSGMTKKELIENLGTVAKSGTTAFVEAMAGGKGDLSAIGQFGVGFYSVYLAADLVEVTSKSNDEPDQWVWSSRADSSFTLRKDPEGNTLGRGTSIKLHLKEDADEYLDQAKLEEIVNKYSAFISYPIYLRKSKEDYVPDEDQPPAEEGGEQKTKAVTTYTWEQLNSQQAIWTRSKDDVTDEEYKTFYKSITKDYADPLTWTHFKAEGEIEFKSIMYVPRNVPQGLYDNYYGKSSSLKLFVRRVLIADEFEDLMPRYLSFVKGVVDSDDLPVNVSREQLAQSKILKVIGKKIVRKILEMLKQLSDEDVEHRKKIRGGEDEKKEDEEEDKKIEEQKFATIWNNFAKSFKLGVIEDHGNRQRIAKMLRFPSTKFDVVTFEEYVERMPETQTNIFFVSGTDLADLKKSPFLERALKKNVEVLLLSDPLDEYLVQNMPEFEGKKLQNLAKEGVKFGDESKDEQRLEQYYKDHFQPLLSWMKGLLGNVVEKVTVSTRVVDTPAIIVTPQFGHSANMERMMKSQTMGNPERNQFMMAKKVMELNPRHPIIVALAARVNQGAEKEAEAQDLAWLLYDMAKLNSGFDVDQAKMFAERMYRLMKSGLNLKDLELVAEHVLPAEAASTDDSGTDLDSKEEL